MMSEVITQPLPTTGNAQQFIERLKAMWNSSQRTLVLSAVLAAIIAAIIVVALWSATQNYRPLYSQQENYDTSEIITILEAEGIAYRLHETNGQVLVGEDEVARIRMLLAAKGVKAQLPSGLETLQDESSLGTSQFIETARYRHGLEGELVRTIIGLNAVSNARVHLAIPRQTLFVRQQTERPSASVMVELKPGKDLDGEQVEAIVNLITGSVTGMQADDVSVVDQYGRLLSVDIGNKQDGKVNAKYLDYQKSVERQVIQRASDMLTPILGPSHFRVQVAADLDFSQVKETQELIDSDPVVQSEYQIENNSIARIAIGVPGSLSNQPPTGERDDDNNNTNQRSEVKRQYVVGSSVRQTQYQQGQVKKLNVAVLLNEAVAPNGTAWTDAEKQQITTMVSEAVGISAERGDTFSLTSFNFTPMPITESAELSWWQDPAMQQPLRYGIGGLIALAMIMFVLRPLIQHLTHIEKMKAELTFAPPSEDEQLAELLETQKQDLDKRLADNGLENTRSALDANQELLPPSGSPLAVQLKHLQLIATEEPERVAEVLKQWVNTNEPHANHQSV